MEKVNFYEAVKKGDFVTTQKFLESGVAINARDSEGRTGLFVAAENGRSAVVKLLLEQGANPDLSDNYSDTPINRSAIAGHLEIVKMLVDHGALYHSPGIGLHPLAGAACGGQLEVVKYLIEEKGVPLDERTEYGGQPIEGAAANRHVDVVQYLINKGADPNQTNAYGSTVFSVVECCIRLNGTTEEEKQKYQKILSIMRKEKTVTPQKSNKGKWKFW